MARILVVDDAQIMCEILGTMLKSAGHEVVGTANCGREALDLYRETRPDLVTLDIQMAGGDGLTCLDNILEHDNDAAVIMVTALASGPREDALNRGAAAYLTKPFQPDQLQEKIRLALGAGEAVD